MAGVTFPQGRAVQLSDAVNATVRRTDGVYVDGVVANGAQSGSASQEANALAPAWRRSRREHGAGACGQPRIHLGPSTASSFSAG